MKIIRDIGMDITRVYNKNKNLAAQDKKRVDKKCDTLEISEEGREIAEYVKMARDMPEVRVQKVEDIKRKLQSGNYNVSPEDLASRILEAISKEEE